MINKYLFNKMVNSPDCISIMLYLNDHKNINKDSIELKAITKKHNEIKDNLKVLVDLKYVKLNDKTYMITNHGKVVTKRMIAICSGLKRD